jgi:hypothetical protein
MSAASNLPPPDSTPHRSSRKPGNPRPDKPDYSLMGRITGKTGIG